MSKKKANKSSEESTDKQKKQQGQGDIHKKILGTELFLSDPLQEHLQAQQISLQTITDLENPFSPLSPYVDDITLPKTYSKSEYEEVRDKLNELRIKFEKAEKDWETKTYRQYLSRYFSKNHVKAILNQNLKIHTGRRQIMTILNADIRGFTQFNKEVDPEYLTELLNEYLIYCTEIIHGHGGVVDKYMGDGILAYFGCFKQNQYHAVEAVKTGIEILGTSNTFFDNWYKKLLAIPKDKYLGVGIGLATGPMYWDHIGSPVRKELTIIGAHVNLVSRLQSIAKSGEILVSNITKGELEKKFNFEKIERREILKGIEGNPDVFLLKNTSGK